MAQNTLLTPHSIPQWCDCCPINLNRHHSQRHRFNPTMVRLLPELSQLKPSPSRKFQSHNGAIAACPSWSRHPTINLFQSHNGAIAASMGSNPPLEGQSVSIPQWCDCCEIATDRAIRWTARFQSHNGAIAAQWTFESEGGNRLFQSHNGAIAA